MTMAQEGSWEKYTYRPNLNRVQEAIVSSHFMQHLSGDSRLIPFDDGEFLARSITIPASTVDELMLPNMLRASVDFARERASAAKLRAAQHWALYGLDDPRQVGTAEFIAEVMFDRHFRRGSRETYSRRVLRDEVAQRIDAGTRIDMVIPALPYKFSCPLKTRGQLPDFAEANFLLGLYEIVVAIEALYREVRSNLPEPLARFTVVSDGNRFNRVVNEPDAVIDAYQRSLAQWRTRLHLEEHIELLDYRTVLLERLPQAALDAKHARRERAQRQYAEIMWPVFDPCDMDTTLRAASQVDPDPEAMNPEGRFVSLLKSLVFIVKYRSLDQFRAWPQARFCALYRELTDQIFEPFVSLSSEEQSSLGARMERGEELPITLEVKECLRQAMLNEVWSAAIGYIAEIKSDRELEQDPLSACLPDHLRWTIHAKPGQLGLLTPAGLGMPVQPWAGAAVFKRTGGSSIRLCTVPVLALEGAGAIPVLIGDSDARSSQPLFYIYPDIEFAGIDEFMSELETRLVRKRTS